MGASTVRYTYTYEQIYIDSYINLLYCISNLFVCIFIYIYIYTYIHIFVFMHIYIYIYLYIYIYIHTHMYTYMCLISCYRKLDILY